MLANCQYVFIRQHKLIFKAEKCLRHDVQSSTLQMIGLRFNMQGEDIFERTNTKCHVFAFSMQEEDILEHINGKNHPCTFQSCVTQACTS